MRSGYGWLNLYQGTWSIFFYLLITICLVACDPGAENKPALRIGTNIWPGYEPLYLARHLGYLEGQNIRLVEYSSTAQVIRSFRNDLIDVAAMTLDEALLLLAQGHQPRVVLVMDVSDGADVIIGKPYIKEFRDLVNKKIGVENTGLGAFFLARALEKHDMVASQINVIPMDIDEQLSAFAADEIDAVVTFEPVRSKLLGRGGRQLFDSSQTPGEIVDVLVVREDFLEKYPQRIALLKQSWFRSLKYFANNPQQAALIMSSRMKLSADETLDSYIGLRLPDLDENNKLLGNGKKASLLLTAEKLSVFMADNKLIAKKMDASVLFPAGH